MSKPNHNSDDTPQHIGKGIASILARAQTGQKPATEPPSSLTPRNQPPRSLSDSGRIHPERRGSLVLSTALAGARGAGIVPDAPSYYLPELIQATLPHTDPKSHAWIRKNGDFSLIIASGIDSEAQHYGIPYGSFPRLVLAHIITQVIANQHKGERRIELSSHFGTFLKEIGYTGDIRGNNRSAKQIKSQMMRLLNSRITFEYKGGDEERGFQSIRNADIAPNFDLWWDFKSLEQDSLFGSWIELSEGFYKAILARPVPLRTDILKSLRKSPLAIDVYMWVSHRLFTMKATKQEKLPVSYGSLHAQFGTGIAEENYRKFRQSLKIAFAKVAAHWKAPHGQQSMLHYEFSENGVILYDSPLTVPRGNRKTQSEEAAAILEVRRFDTATRDKARVRAKAMYSVDYLEHQYFAWIDEKKITPEDPAAHFLTFVSQHITRNR